MDATTGRGRHVLLVEDDPAWQELTVVAIGEVDPTVTVETIADGRRAIERLAAAPVPDLVLLDLNLPGVGGREVLRAASALAVRPRIVVLSASVAPRDRDVVELLGAAELATKPMTFTALCELAGRLLASAG